MAGYAVTNWTRRQTSGVYGSLDAAQVARGTLLEPGDDYSIVEIPSGYVGVGTIVEEGVYEG